MRLSTPKLALGLLFSLTALNAQASLSAFNAAGNTPVVYSSVSNVTWTQDANLFKTLYDANNNLVNLITAVTPSYNDPSWGVQAIGDGGSIDDFDTATGRLSWWGGIAFTNYLNSINYAGSNQWALPSAGANPQFGTNQTSGPLGQLFYSELSGTADNNIPNTANFTNEQDWYWSGTKYAPDPGGAWVFGTSVGFQGYSYEGNRYYAWAVSPGQVAAVPVPGAVWLMGSALIGLLGSKRRGHAG